MRGLRGPGTRLITNGQLLLLAAWRGSKIGAVL